jgi:lipid A 3-O-deacylase
MNAVTRKLCAYPALCKVLAFAIGVFCQPGHYAYSQEGLVSSQTSSKGPDVPVRRTWQIGGFVTGGFPPNYVYHAGIGDFNEELHLFNGGVEAGRMFTVLHGPGLLRGRAEAAVEVIPFWLAHYPKQTLVVHSPLNEFPTLITQETLNYHGVSVTPLLFRWNFMKHESSRFVPWVQLGSGLLWTSQPFPQQRGPGYYTSRINFTPQADFGANMFTKKNQSLNFALKVVHISSAGLGESNPGIPVSVQFSLGYSWWK